MKRLLTILCAVFLMVSLALSPSAGIMQTVPVFWYDPAVPREELNIAFNGMVEGRFPFYTVEQNSSIKFLFDFAVTSIVDLNTGKTIYNLYPSASLPANDTFAFHDLDPYSLSYEQNVAPGIVNTRTLTFYHKGASLQFLKPGKYNVTYEYGYNNIEDYQSFLSMMSGSEGWDFEPALSITVRDSSMSVGADSPYLAPYTTSSVYVDGRKISVEGYNINNNNYFKLRDVAAAVNGTDKQFSVNWNASVGTIELFPGAEYLPIGGELMPGDGSAKYAIPTASPVFFNSSQTYFEAYHIEGANYFKLRDLGSLFDFNVSWDGENNSVIINTAEHYFT